jgi:hypothetical protein
VDHDQRQFGRNYEMADEGKAQLVEKKIQPKVDITKSTEYWSHPPNPMVLDRRRCYRHFGAKSRSPGVAGFTKEPVVAG